MTSWYEFLPHQLLSSLAGRVAQSQIPWLKNWCIRQFCRHYNVDLTESLINDPTLFASFNDFFTRELREGVRPIAGGSQTVISPADGQLVVQGAINERQLLQAKGHYYTIPQLLGDDDWSEKFTGGSYFTVYLSPRDYHRVHMPLTGTLLSMRYIPGRLFPVNRQSTHRVNGVFTRNERLICYFQTDFGPMAVIFVGALLVGQMATVWEHEINVKHPNKTRDWHYNAQDSYQKGAEIGRFFMGSTVICLFPSADLEWNSDVARPMPVTMGAPLATHPI